MFIEILMYNPNPYANNGCSVAVNITLCIHGFSIEMKVLYWGKNMKIVIC